MGERCELPQRGLGLQPKSDLVYYSLLDLVATSRRTRLVSKGVFPELPKLNNF